MRMRKWLWQTKEENWDKKIVVDWEKEKKERYEWEKRERDHEKRRRKWERRYENEKVIVREKKKR